MIHMSSVLASIKQGKSYILMMLTVSLSERN